MKDRTHYIDQTLAGFVVTIYDYGRLVDTYRCDTYSQAKTYLQEQGILEPDWHPEEFVAEPDCIKPA